MILFWLILFFWNLHTTWKIRKYTGKQGAPLCEECCREQKPTWAVKFQRLLCNIPSHKQILQSRHITTGSSMKISHNSDSLKNQTTILDAHKEIELFERSCNWTTSLSLFTFMPWRRKWQPTPVFLPGESQGWGSLVGCHLWGRTESDTTEVT